MLKITMSIAALTLVTTGSLAEDKKQLEVIEVTAQKRVQSIQSIPVAISAVSAKTLQQHQITCAEGIAELIPQLNSTRSLSGLHNYFIRGIGMDDFNLSSVSAIGLYLDDVAINNPMLSNFSLFDVERVEVLRGPQNTLYGKNTTGGAVKFISKQPNIDGGYDGFAQLGLGSYQHRALDAAVNLPINDNMAGRVAVYQQQRDGLTTSSVAGNNTEYNDRNRYAVRAQLLFEPNDEWRFQASLYGGEQDEIAEVKTLMIGDQSSGKIDIEQFNLTRNASRMVDPVNDVSSLGGFLKASWQQDWYSVNWISAFEQVESERADDWGAQYAPSGVSAVINYTASDTQSVSQELQLLSNAKAELQWTLGLLYQKNTGDILQTAFIDSAGRGRPDDAVDDAGIGPLFDRGGWVAQDSQTWSVYGHIDAPITDRLNVGAGLRFSQQQLAPQVRAVGMLMDSPDKPFPLGTFGWYSLGNPNFNPDTDVAGFTVAKQFIAANGGYAASANIDETFNEWGGKLSLDYQLTPEQLIYGSLARGFKMGAVNSNPASAAFLSTLERVVIPETLTTYELGVKSDWLARRLRLNAALFYNHWQDYQFFQVYNPGNPADLFATLVNLPEAKSKGLEAELTWLATDSFTVTAGLGWLDSEVTDATLDTTGVPEAAKQRFQNTVVEGNKLTNAPELVYNVGVEQVVALSDGLLTLSASYQYTDQHIQILAGENTPVWQHNFTQPAYDLIGVNASYQFGEDLAYQLTAWAKNLANEKFCRERATVPGLPTETHRLCAQGDPRMFGLAFRMQFES